jgi:hypothetical protein
MYLFFLGLLENPACVLNFPLLLICPLSCLKGPPSDVVLEAVAYRDVIPTLSRLSRSSPIHLLASQLSPIAFLSHLSSFAFGFFSQDRLQTCGTVCPHSPLLSLTYPPLNSLAHHCCSPVPTFPSSPVYSSPWVDTQKPKVSLSTIIYICAHAPSAPLPFPRRALLVKNIKICPWKDHLMQRV